MFVAIEKKHIRKPESWWLDQIVRNKEALGNRVGVLPAGTRLVVSRKYSGLTVSGGICDKCGLILNISRVKYRDLELEVKA